MEKRCGQLAVFTDKLYNLRLQTEELSNLNGGAPAQFLLHVYLRIKSIILWANSIKARGITVFLYCLTKLLLNYLKFVAKTDSPYLGFRCF